jgi:hypothetical protein
MGNKVRNRLFWLLVYHQQIMWVTRYGINAVETEDTYLRLDRDLAAFLYLSLDGKVGKGQYTAVFIRRPRRGA